MTVAFVVPRLVSGGAEHVMRIVSSRLQEQQAERIVLVSLLDKPEDAANQPGLPVEVIRLGCSRVMFALPALMCTLLRERVQVVVSTLPYVIRLVSLVKALTAGRFYHVARLANTYSQQKSHASGKFNEPVWMTRMVNLGVDNFIAVSGGVKDDFVKTYGVNAAKVTVINNPVDLTRFVYTNAPVLDKGPSHVLMVGRLVEQKNVQLALHALQRLKQLVDKPVRLTLVGEGTLLDDLKQLADKLGVAGDVDFRGFQRNVGDYYKAADVLLMTSYYEGFPNVLVEGLAHGVAVVSVDCPSGPSDILVAPELGMLTGYDADEIARAMQHCLEDLAGTRGREARTRFVKDTFSIDSISGQYWEIIRTGMPTADNIR
ncbi:MAG: glycosyltransferase [Alphaproteobacteria bacterium]|nr:MAG: glycosyltransferase [Alphaproteobacteria bacterium]